MKHDDIVKGLEKSLTKEERQFKCPTAKEEDVKENEEAKKEAVEVSSPMKLNKLGSMIESLTQYFKKKTIVGEYASKEDPILEQTYNVFKDSKLKSCLQGKYSKCLETKDFSDSKKSASKDASAMESYSSLISEKVIISEYISNGKALTQLMSRKLILSMIEIWNFDEEFPAFLATRHLKKYFGLFFKVVFNEAAH